MMLMPMNIMIFSMISTIAEKVFRNEAIVGAEETYRLVNSFFRRTLPRLYAIYTQ